MEYNPYTYLIGWSHLFTYYYGCEYGNSSDRVANPNNLWTIYFTSSKHVTKFREEYGEPDVVEVRKIFTNAKSCRLWESKVLDRLKVTKKSYFLNKRGGSWKWATHQMNDEIKRKISESSRGKKMPQETSHKRLLTLKANRISCY